MGKYFYDLCEAELQNLVKNFATKIFLKPFNVEDLTLKNNEINLNHENHGRSQNLYHSAIQQYTC